MPLGSTIRVRDGEECTHMAAKPSGGGANGRATGVCGASAKSGANATLATIPEGKRYQPIACMDGWPRPVRAPGVRPGRIEQRAALLGAGAGDGYIAASPTPASMA